MTHDQATKIVWAAFEFMRQIDWSYDKYGPYVGDTESEYKNNLSLYLQKYIPDLLPFEDEVRYTVHEFWPIEKCSDGIHSDFVKSYKPRRYEVLQIAEYFASL